MQVPGFRQAKFLLFPPATSCSVRSGTHCFSGHLVVDVHSATDYRAVQRLFWGVWPAAPLPGMPDSGYTLLLLKEYVLLLLVLESAAIAGRADGASGTPVVASLAGATQSADGRADGVFFLEP